MSRTRPDAGGTKGTSTSPESAVVKPVGVEPLETNEPVRPRPIQLGDFDVGRRVVTANDGEGARTRCHGAALARVRARVAGGHGESPCPSRRCSWRSPRRSSSPRSRVDPVSGAASGSFCIPSMPPSRLTPPVLLWRRRHVGTRAHGHASRGPSRTIERFTTMPPTRSSMRPSRRAENQ